MNQELRPEELWLHRSGGQGLTPTDDSSLFAGISFFFEVFVVRWKSEQPLMRRGAPCDA
jgi:hypothetical protein